MLSIRWAFPEDAEAIHLILQESWGESLQFAVFRDQVASRVHQVFVAAAAGEVVGFLSAFLVPIPTPRWELDLILVHPENRGQGVGTALVQEALRFGSHFRVCSAQARIRVDNYPSQRAFSKAGFTKDAQATSLLLWNPMTCESAMGADLPEAVQLIHVDTLLYRGLWIEGLPEADLSFEEQRRVIAAARNSVFHEDRLNAGMFVPNNLKQSLAPDLLAAAEDFGEYHRWAYRFK